MTLKKGFKEFDDLYKYLSKQSKDLLIGLIYGISRGDSKRLREVVRYIKRESRRKSK